MTLRSLLFAGLLGAMTFSFTAASQAFGGQLIVNDGEPRAQIVIAEQSPRTVVLAAEELQSHLEQISGTTVPIVHAPVDGTPVAIYIGRSEYTDRLGVHAHDLQDGAFRMVSGDNWLVLLGHDADFVPREPYTMHGGRDAPDRLRVLREWDERSGGTWNNPMLGLRRTFNDATRLWVLDKRGSLNAVYQFLRDLGVEWYMPGEVGQIIPQRKTIELPTVDRTVEPDYKLRVIHPLSLEYFSQQREDILWQLRLGLNGGSDKTGLWNLQSHGMLQLLQRPEMKEAHPEYYAIWSGKRMIEEDGKPCLSSEGLFQEHVRYVRAVFDIYEVPMLSVMPPDGYARLCECESCRPQGTPQRGPSGSMSDYVWGYVNRVAAEVYKTHPDRLVSCYAYSTYVLPPEKLEKLSPNLVVGMVHGRSGNLKDAKTRENLEQIRGQWRALSAHDLLIWEHYVFTHRGTIWPAYFPRTIAEGLKALQEISHGELVEVASAHNFGKGHSLHEPGFNHLNVFVTARMYWDADQNIDALLDRYYTEFYGPAAEPMKAFVDAAHGYWRDPNERQKQIPLVLDLFEKAKQAAPSDSIYGQRIAMLDTYLDSLRQLREQLARGREGVPEARAKINQGPSIVLDGQLNDEAWQNANVYALRDVQSGEKPTAAANFRVYWEGQRQQGSLYFGIRCEEPDAQRLDNLMKPVADAAKLWYGDNVELLIETQSHSYYQIAIAPDGTVVDLDRQGGLDERWKSGVDVATFKGDGFWSVEVRVHVDGSDVADDPLHNLVGKRPILNFPWFVNVCRQRPNKNGPERSAFSPTGHESFHDPMKFGKLYVR